MSFTEIEFYVEASEAMVPAIKEGDIVVINTGNSSFYSIAVGDVIIYHNYDIDMWGEWQIFKFILQVKADRSERVS
jgi:hypothetical protein